MLCKLSGNGLADIADTKGIQYLVERCPERILQPFEDIFHRLFLEADLFLLLSIGRFQHLLQKTNDALDKAVASFTEAEKEENKTKDTKKLIKDLAEQEEVDLGGNEGESKPTPAPEPKPTPPPPPPPPDKPST